MRAPLMMISAFYNKDQPSHFTEEKTEDQLK